LREPNDWRHGEGVVADRDTEGCIATNDRGILAREDSRETKCHPLDVAPADEFAAFEC
jgi:hypothetical protein